MNATTIPLNYYTMLVNFVIHMKPRCVDLRPLGACRLPYESYFSGSGSSCLISFGDFCDLCLKCLVSSAAGTNLAFLGGQQVQ